MNLNKEFIMECLSKVHNDPSDTDESEQKDIEMLRTAIMAELDAANLYEQMAAQASSEATRNVFLSIAEEEKVHVGEFSTVLEGLDTEYENSMDEGEKEVEDMM